MKTTKAKCTELHFDPANARTHDERNITAIKASLSRFGQQKPLVVDANNVVVAGNGTLTAAMQLGWDEVAVVKTNLKGAEAVAFAIADNRTAELAGWDDKNLSRVLISMPEDLLNDLGWSDDATTEVIDGMAEAQFDNEEPSGEPKTCPECGAEIT